VKLEMKWVSLTKIHTEFTLDKSSLPVVELFRILFARQVKLEADGRVDSHTEVVVHR